MKKLKHLALLLATSVMASSAFAEIDVSAATTAISTDGSAAITGIGTALIGVAALAVVFKWAKGAIFG
ncbi:major capsid protein [uncultured Endozoicomonas sp.]|uniref:major capsid protein n=1 Tax=uncultured Endozoicomonas sp. TaxID=432652 RepID=UPI002616D168|nr:major capsid protein [uncultured Endozoicomonas sp.]